MRIGLYTAYWCQERFLAGDRAAAAMALSDELIDSAAIACTPAGLESRLADYESLGADTLLCMPFGDRPAIVDALVAANRAYASA